jgi:hypothetical protein
MTILVWSGMEFGLRKVSWKLLPKDFSSQLDVASTIWATKVLPSAAKLGGWY